MQIAGGTLLATELMERLIGFDRLQSLVKRFAARAERFSGVQVGEGWLLALPVALGAAALLSYPVALAVYVLLSLGFGILPSVSLPVLAALGFLASIMWVGLAAAGWSVKAAESPDEASISDGADEHEGPSLEWTLRVPRWRMQSEMSARPAGQVVEDARPADGQASTLRERVIWASVLSSAVPLGAATFLVLFLPSFSLWLVSRGMTGLAEGLRTAVVVTGFVLFLSGLCLQLSATF